MRVSSLLNKKFTNSIKLIGMATTLAISIGYTEIAQALNVSTSGIWTDFTGSPYDFNGLGTKKISWGLPAYSDSDQSSYVFEGVNDFDLDLDGSTSTFELGTFTHNNFPIYVSAITGANLALNLDLESIGSKTFNLSFGHDETPNSGYYDDAYGNRYSGYSTAWYHQEYWDNYDYGQYSGWRYCGMNGWQLQSCQDVVSLPTLISEEHIDINGEKYQLVVSGFYQNNELTTRFITEENKSNTAKIYGRLRRVPEPATVLGLLAIGTIGTFSLKKKKLSRAC